MLRIRALALIFCCLAGPFAFGLGLGPLKSSSALNEPFEGRIEIIGAKAEDFDTLTIGIADPEHFERAGIERPPVLLQLRFTIDDSATGANVISVTSKDPIREPFLNFLLELNWSNGRLLREYTVLLDPPLYDPNRRRVAPAPVVRVEEPAPAAPADSSPEPYEPPAPAASISGAYVSGSEIGPMVATDTLWPIAAKYRPDESVTVNQMMLALLRDNPAAFGEANVNRLMRGAILRLPDEAGLRSVSAEEAFAEIKRQNLLWEADRQEIGAPAVASSEAASTESEGTDARLELVAPNGADGGAAPGSAGRGQGSELLREELDATSQTNLELEDKLTEAEEIINLLQRQVNIQDEDLAALRARLAELGVEHGDLGAVDEPTESVPEMIATVEPEIGPETEPEVDAEPEADMAAAPVDAVEEDIAQEDIAQEDIAQEDTRDFTESLASKVPGGAATVLGIVTLVILGLFVGVVQFLLKRRSGRAGADIAAEIAQAKLASDRLRELGLKNSFLKDDASEAITSMDDVDDAAADFDHAYEHYDQAPELVERVIAEHPDRHEYKLRLLEVYFSSNDKSAYEEAARSLHEGVGDADPLWESAVAMWSVMSPERALFEAGAEAAAEPAPDQDSAKAFVDITGEDEDESATGDHTVAHTSGGDASDLLDVTKTGDLTSVEDKDLLNVTAPELSADEELADAAVDSGEDAGLDITDITAEDDSSEAADAGLDFDISDTVAPAFEINTDEEGEDIVDLSDTGDMEDIASEAVSAEDDLLEFDIGGLDTDIEVTGAEDDAVISGLDADDMPTVDLDSALEVAEGVDGADAEGDLDFDITIGEEDLSDGLDITGVDDGEDEGMEITMGTPEETPADGEMSLQGAELDELALDAGELEIGEDASLDDLTMELDAVIDDPSGGELDLNIEAIVEDEGDGHLKTVALDADLGTDLDDDGEKTVVMPMSDDVERQSDIDEADTKLNLSKAYIELGDTEGARSILDEVASDGNDEQKTEAKALLDQISD